MKRLIEGEDRSQVTLLPECLDDYVGEDNPVRVVDAFVEELDYLDSLKTADRTQPIEIGARTERLQEKIRKLRQQMHEPDGIRDRLKS